MTSHDGCVVFNGEREATEGQDSSDDHTALQPIAIDRYAWWEDRQVAVALPGRTLRGWVRQSRRASGPDVAGQMNDAFGRMDIVLFHDTPADRERYPSEVTVIIERSDPHGRPAGVQIWKHCVPRCRICYPTAR
jgi:hypothetical protein